MKNYETPELLLVNTDANDVLTASVGDTPIVTWEW